MDTETSTSCGGNDNDFKNPFDRQRRRLSELQQWRPGGDSAFAYDGTKCKEPGVCWEPKPGFPDKIAGSKYDPKHDPAELAKQGDSERAMEERNAKRTENFVKTGKWVYDVSKF